MRWKEIAEAVSGNELHDLTHSLDGLPDIFMRVATDLIVAMEKINYTVHDIRRSRISNSTYILFAAPKGRFRKLTQSEKRDYINTGASVPGGLESTFNVRISDHAGHGDGTVSHSPINIKRDIESQIKMATIRASMLSQRPD